MTATGGGIYNEGEGTLEILQSAVVRNTAPRGGGITNRGYATIEDSTTSPAPSSPTAASNGRSASVRRSRSASRSTSPSSSSRWRNVLLQLGGLDAGGEAVHLPESLPVRWTAIAPDGTETSGDSRLLGFDGYEATGTHRLRAEAAGLVVERDLIVAE